VIAPAHTEALSDEEIGVARTAAQKFWRTRTNRRARRMFDRDELLSYAVMGVIDAKRRVRDGRTRNGFLYRRAWGAIADAVRAAVGTRHREVYRAVNSAVPFSVLDDGARRNGAAAGVTGQLAATEDPEPAADDFWALVARTLSARDAAAVVLYYRDGVSMADTGRAIGLSESGTLLVLRRALRQLRSRPSMLVELQARRN